MSIRNGDCYQQRNQSNQVSTYMISWKTLSSASQLDSIVEDSHNIPQIIFKHSTTCPISGMAKRRLEGKWDLNLEPYYLDLLSYRSISNEIASRFGVQHESPQVIMIIDGQARYDESHLDISADTLKQHLESNLHG